MLKPPFNSSDKRNCYPFTVYNGSEGADVRVVPIFVTVKPLAERYVMPANIFII